jgi:hypothetical protein
MDVIWNANILTIHILEPFSPIENWSVDLPEHIPGSITLNPEIARHRHWSDPPMRFRYAFYNIPSVVFNLVDANKSWEWLVAYEQGYVNDDVNVLMKFVQYFNISREEFDEAMARDKVFRIELGNDFTQERFELPNTDIIFTFDNDIIRYFYRRE